MNLFNQVLILVIVLIFINYITDGKLLEIIKINLNIFKNNIEPFIGLTYKSNRGPYKTVPNIPNNGQLDYPYHNYNYNQEMNNLYFFLSNLITNNTNIYELTSSNNRKINATYCFEKKILNYLHTILNKGNYLFKNIKFIDKIYYYDNPRGKEIESFKFVSDVYLKNNRPINKLYFYIELFLRNDIQFKEEIFVILNIRLVDNNSKIVAKQKMKKMNNNMVNSVNDIFIINDNKINTGYDSDNSLIPSSINISNDATESS